MLKYYNQFDNTFFNIHIRVFLRLLKCIANLVRGFAENPWVRYSLKKKAGNKGEGARPS
jgi:hypothetical protein